MWSGPDLGSACLLAIIVLLLMETLLAGSAGRPFLRDPEFAVPQIHRTGHGEQTTDRGSLAGSADRSPSGPESAQPCVEEVPWSRQDHNFDPH